jgi:hypothetical protein
MIPLRLKIFMRAIIGSVAVVVTGWALGDTASVGNVQDDSS